MDEQICSLQWLYYKPIFEFKGFEIKQDLCFFFFFTVFIWFSAGKSVQTNLLNNRAISENNVFDVIMRWKRSHSGHARALAHRVNNRSWLFYYCLHWSHLLSMVERLMPSAGCTLYYCKVCPAPAFLSFPGDHVEP